MRLPEQPGIQFRQSVERVKREVPLTEYAARYTELRSVGNRMAGRCPLPDHDDSTPSFQVYLHDGEPASWWCFGCSRGSDILDLHQLLHDHHEKWTALVELSEEYGIGLRASDAWFRKNERQKPIRDELSKGKIEIARRRLYRWVMEPIVLSVEDPAERHREAERVWKELYYPARLIVARLQSGMFPEADYYREEARKVAEPNSEGVA